MLLISGVETLVVFKPPPTVGADCIFFQAPQAGKSDSHFIWSHGVCRGERSPRKDPEGRVGNGMSSRVPLVLCGHFAADGTP